MKSLSEFINESVINEAKQDILLVWCVSDYDYTLHICTGSNSDIKKYEREIDDYSYCSTKATVNGNVCSVMWNDESCYISAIKGNNWNDAMNHDIKKIEGFLKKKTDDYVYIESDIFGSGNEWYDEDIEKTKSWDAKRWLNHFIKMVKDSYVDGDSNYCRAVVDIAKREIYCKGSNDVQFWDINDFAKEYL